MQKQRAINALTSNLRQIRDQFFAAMVLLLALPGIGLAQEVTLRFADGQDSISGTLTDFKDERFFIIASIGLVVIPTDGVFCVGDACPEQTRLQIESADVVLTSKDGDVFITGDLIEIDNDEYVIATALGEQRIAVGLVDCKGAGCIAVSANADVDKIVELSAGGITFRGTLVAFENDTFVLDHAVMGEVRVSASKFECQGPGCP